MSTLIRYCPNSPVDPEITVYVVFRGCTPGELYNSQTTEFEAYNSANWGQYAIELTAEPGGCWYYEVAAGLSCVAFNYAIHLQEAVAPATSDPQLASWSPPIECCGSTIVTTEDCAPKCCQSSSILDKYRNCYTQQDCCD